MARKTAWIAIIVANVAVYCVLGLWQSAEAQRPTTAQLPFANSIEQREDMVSELRAIRDLLKEQNALLKSGQLQVVVTLPQQAAESR